MEIKESLNTTKKPSIKDKIRGMIIGGAVGDSLGAPIEFRSIDSIIGTYGEPGITYLEPAFGKLGNFTDDTQMLLWTAEGLLRASNVAKAEDKKIYELDNIPQVVLGAYFRWFSTQGRMLTDFNDGYMITVKELHASRAPGTTCLGGLGNSYHKERLGTPENPIHHGDGCGAVMRMAPVGLLPITSKEAFDLGLKLSALSHGERGAIIAGAMIASITRDILDTGSLETAVENSINFAKEVEGSKRVVSLVSEAVDLAKTDPGNRELLASLGAAWRGDEAIALSVYAALSYPDDFRKAVIFAVNHSGDSDSTGAIVGNMLGLLLGYEVIPQEWKEPIELSELLEDISNDLYKHFITLDFDDNDKYPPTLVDWQ